MRWQDKAACIDMDTNLFFDTYEEDVDIRPAIDSLCVGCPVNKQCFAVAVSQKSWGVHGGVYLKEGIPDKEFNLHKNSIDWYNIWESLTMEVK